jgi:hypothetical protein
LNWSPLYSAMTVYVPACQPPTERTAFPLPSRFASPTTVKSEAPAGRDSKVTVPVGTITPPSLSATCAVNVISSPAVIGLWS